ncbi:MAG: membrane-bound lytic murein transglycosylase D [Cellvibrionaceae bacterium]|jgi:membrane-bound lytic murein transglycosylase D
MYIYLSQLLTKVIACTGIILLSACQSGYIKKSSDPAAAQQLTDVYPQSSQREYLSKSEPEPQSVQERLVGDTANEIISKKSTIAATVNPPEKDLLQRVRSGFQFADSISQDSRGQALIERYLQRLLNNPSSVNDIMANATPYLHYVVNKLEKHDMPLEFALLPIVESRYDPFAYSPGRASGLWQFIPSTGQRFGLKQDWWQDQRRDTAAATDSAIQYLESLHKRFDNDWLLALAAYNAGQGNVARAIRKNRKLSKPTDYWALELPLETRHYVPKLLAWRRLLLEAEHYQITLPAIPDEPYFEIVDVGSQIDLAKAAELAELAIDKIYQLNPAFNRWATDPFPPHNLLFPREHAQIFRDNLESLSIDQRLTWQRYTIKRGDSLIEVAKRFNTTPSLIAKVNNLPSHLIRAGRALLISSASEESEFYSKSADQRLAKRQQKSPGANKRRIQHQVMPGDSLWSIARDYDIDLSTLAKWNGMARKDLLSVGKKLVIWKDSTTIVKPAADSTVGQETRKLTYTVKQGDSLSEIADKFRIRIGDIKSWNQKVSSQKYIKPGQLLTLYIQVTDRRELANQ